MPRGFESLRLRQKQHPAGCCFLFLRQTMQGLQGGIRTARARRFASRRGKMPRWGIFRARENSRVCAKSSTLRGAAFYFCGKLCKGCKVGFEQPGAGESVRLRHIRRRIERFCGRYFFRPKYGVSSLYNDQRRLKLPATYTPLQKGQQPCFPGCRMPLISQTKRPKLQSKMQLRSFLVSLCGDWS